MAVLDSAKYFITSEQIWTIQRQLSQLTQSIDLFYKYSLYRAGSLIESKIRVAEHF